MEVFLKNVSPIKKDIKQLRKSESKYLNYYSVIVMAKVLGLEVIKFELNPC